MKIIEFTREGASKVLQKTRETAMQKPGLAYGGAGAISGAILVFLINGQSEGEKQDTAILNALAGLQEQSALILHNQDTIRSRLVTIEQMQDVLSKRQERLERKQTEAEHGQIRLRAEWQEYVQRDSYRSHRPLTYIDETIGEILDMEKEKIDAWIARGPPYADTDILSRRLGRRISADERDRAAALIGAARDFGIDP